MKRVLVVANDYVGVRMAGPGIRSYRFASELSKHYDVTLAAPKPCDLDVNAFEIVETDPWSAAHMTALAIRYDVVIAQRLPVETMHAVARSPTRAIYDLYAPITIEDLALEHRRDETRSRNVAYRLNSIMQAITIANGDAFICASEEQRDFWLGWLAALGRIDRTRYAGDRSIRSFIDVVPFGIEPEPPRATHPVLKGVIPGIHSDDKVLLWGGGIWNWFDPLTVIRAVHRLSQRRDDIRLYFLGLGHPNPHVPQMDMTRRAIALADELGLTKRVVFFNHGWVPYAERGAYYAEADVGVAAHFDDLETHFAFRTRLLDCFWAGIPVVTTRGDSLSRLVVRRGLGHVVDYEEVEGWVAAIEAALDQPEGRVRIAAAAAEVRAELAWPRVVGRLAELVETTAKAGVPRRDILMSSRYMAARLENALRRHGPKEAATRLANIARGRANSARGGSDEGTLAR